MEIYFLLILIIGLLSFVIITYLKKISLEEYEYTLIIKTHNCANICEGVLREAFSFVKNMGNYQIIVVDLYSKDDTYEILKRLSLKYVFPLLRRKQFDSNDTLEGFAVTKKYNLLVLTKDTTYFNANTEINRIRQSSTYNTSFH